jgi:hypothetical protein
MLLSRRGRGRDPHRRADRVRFLEAAQRLVHILSLILIFWGIVLAADQLLPR